MVIAFMLAASIGVAAEPQIDSTKISFSRPAPVVEIDVGKLKGNLVRMGWSPDGTQVYLQTADPDTRGNVKLRHYTMGLDGQLPKNIAAEPDWAAAYWTWKSAQAAPGMASLRIGVEQQQKRVSATSNPSGGDMAKGGASGGGAGAAGSGGGSAGGMSIGEAVGAAYQTQNATVVTLRLKGEVVGEFINAPALPGTTFSWGPTGSGLIAFVALDGHMIVMDGQSRKKDVAGSKAACLPAWTTDGKRIVYLEKTGRKKYLLRVVDVTIPTT